MEIEDEKLSAHHKFRELCALINTGTLTPIERTELRDHLWICAECREIHDQYLLLVKEGIPLLSARYNYPHENENWDDRITRRKLLARVRGSEGSRLPDSTTRLPLDMNQSVLRRMVANRLPLTLAALAACLVAAAVSGAYRLGSRAQVPGEVPQVSIDGRFQKLTAEKKSVDELLESQTNAVTQLQERSRQREQQLTKLRSQLQTTEDSQSRLTAATTAAERQLEVVSQQRDSLIAQLRDAEAAYEKVQTELANFQAARDNTLLRTASLESRIDELTTANRDQELRLKSEAEYLASDQDIRELMGARKLYIADVFDVDSHSQTHKPFGRVFYTQGKSLIFYAFDLDDRPGVNDSDTFQAWGRKESSEGKTRSLGIFYMDSEANRRWVLRCDDPSRLAEIDAVFVTVEPNGGSQKPTGKPYLYALLRKEANHP